MSELFEPYKKRLNVLSEEERLRAVKYAEEFYHRDKCTKEEALEKGIVKAEMEFRKL